MRLNVIFDHTTNTIYSNCKTPEGGVDARQVYLFSHLVPGLWCDMLHEEQLMVTAEAHGWDVVIVEVDEPSQSVADIEGAEFLVRSESNLYRPKTVYEVALELLAKEVGPKLLEKETLKFLKAALGKSDFSLDGLAMVDRNAQNQAARGATQEEIVATITEGMTSLAQNRHLITASDNIFGALFSGDKTDD